MNFDKYNEYDVELANELSHDNSQKILFVGRLAPNKRQEDIVNGGVEVHNCSEIKVHKPINTYLT
jgi:hypothetical protein